MRDKEAFPQFFLGIGGEVVNGVPKQGHKITSMGGLTKRELFAAMAMQGLVANPARIDEPGPILVNLAIAYADTLIKELEKDAL